MRMRSPTRMGRPRSTLRTPKAWTSPCLPRCTMAMTLGGPPCLATRVLRAPSRSASRALAPSRAPWSVPAVVPFGVAAITAPHATTNATAIDYTSKTVFLIWGTPPLLYG